MINFLLLTYIVTLALFVIFAIINATIGEQSIPLEATILTDESRSTVAEEAAPPVGVDAGLISAVLALGTAFVYGYRKNAARTDAAADSLLNLSQSVKGTDTGAKDTAELVARIAKQISDANPDMAKALINCVPAADKNAEEWKKDLKEYYDNIPPDTNEDIGLDKTRTKLKQVNNITKPTPEP